MNRCDTGAPCESISADGWLRCIAPSSPTEVSHTGKWMVWPVCGAADTAWQYIRGATTEGALAVAAKIGDSRSCPEGEHLVCVYTADWRDLEDVERVALQLRNAGATNWMRRARPLYYKADEQTRRGFYARAGVPASLFSFNLVTGEIRPERGLRAFAIANPEAEVLMRQFVDGGIAIPRLSPNEEQVAHLLTELSLAPVAPERMARLTHHEADNA